MQDNMSQEDVGKVEAFIQTKNHVIFARLAKNVRKE